MVINDLLSSERSLIPGVALYLEDSPSNFTATVKGSLNHVSIFHFSDISVSHYNPSLTHIPFRCHRFQSLLAATSSNLFSFSRSYCFSCECSGRLIYCDSALCV